MGILSNCEDKLREYERLGLHYELVAKGIYAQRQSLATPLSAEYAPYILAGLVAFDMGRSLGDRGEFLANLTAKMENLRVLVESLVDGDLATADLSRHQPAIISAYEDLRDLTGQRKFHVGATKILHWISPALFLMIDRNAAAAFADQGYVSFARSTRPGYSGEKYVKCLRAAQEEIGEYGQIPFNRLDPSSPSARTFDKIAFITGRTLLKANTDQA